MQRCEGAACTDFVNALFFLVGEHGHVVDPLIEPSKTYRYRVYTVFPDPVTEFAVSAASNIVEVDIPAGALTVLEFAPGETSEDDPAAVTATPGPSGVELSWALLSTEPRADGSIPVGYVIQACFTADCGGWPYSRSRKADRSSGGSASNSASSKPRATCRSCSTTHSGGTSARVATVSTIEA